MKSRVIPIVILSLLLAPIAADAADPPKGGADPAAAQGLFYEARTLMGQNKWAEACPKLEESYRLDAGVGTTFNLADCNEHLGKLASAWAGFLEVAAVSKAANQPDREKLARKRAHALEPRLAKLVVVVSDAPEGLEVKRDGILVGAAAWATPIPVDPGTHRISATAPGKQPWETTVESAEGKTARVTVPRALPAASPVVVATILPIDVAPKAPAPEVQAPAPIQSFPPAIVQSVGSTQRVIGWVVTGVGAVGLGLGAGFGLSSMSKRNESRTHCVLDACDPVGVNLRDDAIRSGNIATIATIAGGAAVVAGLVVVLTARKSTGERGRSGAIRRGLNAGVGVGSFTLQGAF